MARRGGMFVVGFNAFVLVISSLLLFTGVIYLFRWLHFIITSDKHDTNKKIAFRLLWFMLSFGIYFYFIDPSFKGVTKFMLETTNGMVSIEYAIFSVTVLLLGVTSMLSEELEKGLWKHKNIVKGVKA